MGGSTKGALSQVLTAFCLCWSKSRVVGEEVRQTASDVDYASTLKIAGRVLSGLMKETLTFHLEDESLSI